MCSGGNGGVVVDAGRSIPLLWIDAMCGSD